MLIPITAKLPPKARGRDLAALRPGLFGVLALVGALVMAHYYAPPETAGLQQQVQQLSRQIADLEHRQSFASAAVDDARDSVAYIYGVYHVSGRARVFAPASRERVCRGAGPSRHQSARRRALYGDREVAIALRQGGSPVLEKLIAYFPGSPLPVTLEVAAAASEGDLALLRIEPTPFTRNCVR